MAFSLDFSKSEKEINSWVNNLSFQRGEAGKHFKKHEKILNNVGLNITDRNSYLSAAQENIVNTIFRRGFVLRSETGDQMAFFRTLKQKEPHPEGLLFSHEPMTSIGKVRDGSIRIHTFFNANGKTVGLALNNFPYKYVAYFENGIALRGWQKIETTYHFGNKECKAESPIELSERCLIEVRSS